ncbi:MAG: BF2992 family fimbrillin-A clan protein [Bacteroidales bacterium]|nr:BF2992 family fimbrillin-A clan protein [Candidatus Cryptobacteroides equifaecalis]
MKELLKNIALLCAAVALVSCGSGKLAPDVPEAVQVLIKAPSNASYSVPGPRALTKAGEGSDGFDQLFIPDLKSVGTVKGMPEGSTLWLLIEIPGPGYKYKENYNDPSEVVEPASWQESEYSYKPYVVGANGAMYPCETEDVVLGNEVYRQVKHDALSGEILSSGSALMLPFGLYKFHAVAPASPLLVRKDGVDQAPVVHIHNGEYVQATDVRWKETYPKGVLIRGDSQMSGVQSISLASLVNQTARVTVNIRCGDENVRMLSLQKSGIEISGIQEDRFGDFSWTMDGKPIETRIGNKYEGAVFREVEQRKEGGRDVITAHVSILPTDARANTIYLLFHLIVNNVPTQFMVGVTNQLYEAANEYVFNFNVKMDGNVTVGTWDNNTLIYEGVELK